MADDRRGAHLDPVDRRWREPVVRLAAGLGMGSCHLPSPGRSLAVNVGRLQSQVTCPNRRAIVCSGRKAQVLVRSGMDILEGNHPSKRKVFKLTFTRVAKTSPNPGRRSVCRSSSQLRSFMLRRLFSMLQWLRNGRSVSLGLHSRGGRLVSRYPLWMLHQWLSPLSLFPPLRPAAPRETPVPPGYSRLLRCWPRMSAAR